MTPEELEKAQFLIGPWLIGSFVDVLFQGILFCQFAHYFGMYRDDKLTLKLAVAGLMIITTLKSIQSFASVWIQNVLYFNDLDGAIMLDYTQWWLSGNSLIVACIGLYVQTFFLYRLYGISGKKWWIVAPVAVLLTFAFCAVCIATYYITLGVSYGPQIAIWFAAHLSTVFAGDLMVTLSTAFFLLRSRKEVLPQTVGIIDALIRLTFSTAAPAALCAMFNLLFSQIYSGSVKLISAGFNQALPKLYAFSMMWTLNARRSIRMAGGSRVYTSENSAPRRPISNDMELGVQVSTETSRHLDIRAMFNHSTSTGTGTGTDIKSNATSEDPTGTLDSKVN
ncbi:hypothetical protein APHAL10511_007957 [Amanita phalloides]|nr:hypothetical protein APHAL10511_007957 [Amanita phalloides]